jgi:hypothetical protein
VLHRVDVQRTEPTAEGLVLVARERLVAEYEHLPVEPRLADLAELIVGQLLREIDAGDFCADMGVRVLMPMVW